MCANPSPIYFYEKGGMTNFTRFAASVLGRDNIRVNCVSPGSTLTPSMQSRIDNTPDPAATLQSFNDRQPMGRMGKPEEVADAVVYLASDLASYVNGQNIRVNGGQFML